MLGSLFGPSMASFLALRTRQTRRNDVRRLCAGAGAVSVVLATAGLAHAQTTASGDSTAQGATAGQEPVPTKSIYRRRVQVEERAIELQASGGYQQGVGSIGGEAASHVQDVAGAGAGLDISGGFRWTSHWFFGAYASAAWFGPATAAEQSLHSYAIGVQSQLHVRPRRSIDPWLGIGIGYRVFSFTPQGQAASAHKALELPRLALGVDYRVSDAFAIGPILAADMSLFFNEAQRGETGSTRMTIGSFVSLGISARFDFFGDDTPKKSERAAQ
jgi:hypothetical protein